MLSNSVLYLFIHLVGKRSKVRIETCRCVNKCLDDFEIMLALVFVVLLCHTCTFYINTKICPGVGIISRVDNISIFCHATDGPSLNLH